ncbi:MAG: hypothetical protein H3C58_08880, partial [Fimbriimonadaceae bacterium]|nr:hypothetical protein [Fimbriimonadaceae bacterium]
EQVLDVLAKRHGNSAVLEQEMMGIAETELRYQALTEMTSRYFRGLRDAIKEGRG